MTLTYYRDYQELFAGCVAYWDGSNAGTTLYDIIGSYNGTLVGSPTAVQNSFGISKAFGFNGSSNYITTSIVPNYSSGTFIIRIKRNATGVYHCMFGCQNMSSPWYSNYLHFRGDNNKIEYVYSQGAAASSLLSTVAVTNTSDYYTIAVTWNNSTAGSAIYINGILNASNSVSAANTSVSNTAYIMASHDSDGNPVRKWCNGNLEFAMLYNRSLSAVEIAEIYQLTRQKYLYPIFPGHRGVE